MMFRLLCIVTVACLPLEPGEHISRDQPDPFVVVLGIAQDAGYPHPACNKECCLPAWKDPSRARGATCLAIVDPASKQRWMVEATPNFPHQLRMLDELVPLSEMPANPTVPLAASINLAGILLTHSHIGHYAGLMFLGREGVGTHRIPAHVMPRMAEFLRSNGPWSQLVALENITISTMNEDVEVKLNDRISIVPFRVPHREEFAEVIGFLIRGPQRSVLFIPDIDKWDQWERKIEDEIRGVDYALIDGTFFHDGEVPGRSMDEIPHPFVTETMKRLAPLSMGERAKVRFIHLNHTNPLLQPESPARDDVLKNGFRIAAVGERLPL